MEKDRKAPVYGGQVLLERVNFGGKDYAVSAIRRKDKSIDYYPFT